MDRADRLNLNKRVRALEEQAAPEEDRMVVSPATRQYLAAVIKIRVTRMLDSCEGPEDVLELLLAEGVDRELAEQGAPILDATRIRSNALRRVGWSSG